MTWPILVTVKWWYRYGASIQSDACYSIHSVEAGDACGELFCWPIYSAVIFYILFWSLWYRADCIHYSCYNSLMEVVTDVCCFIVTIVDVLRGYSLIFLNVLIHCDGILLWWRVWWYFCFGIMTIHSIRWPVNDLQWHCCLSMTDDLFLTILMMFCWYIPINGVWSYSVFSKPCLLGKYSDDSVLTQVWPEMKPCLCLIFLSIDWYWWWWQVCLWEKYYVLFMMREK
jgi:hypothetical protein